MGEGAERQTGALTDTDPFAALSYNQRVSRYVALRTLLFKQKELDEGQQAELESHTAYIAEVNREEEARFVAIEAARSEARVNLTNVVQIESVPRPSVENAEQLSLIAV